MPKVEASVETLLRISRDVREGVINKLVIKRYKTGKNAGKMFAEYSLRTTPPPSHTLHRSNVANVLERAAQHLSTNTLKDLFIQKHSEDDSSYAYRIETKGGTE